MRLLLLYRRRWWLFYLPVVLCAALTLWWSATHWRVLPPDRMVIAAGTLQGSYSLTAQRYAEQLSRRGLRVDIVYSDTQQGALDRLRQPGGLASIGFSQGIYAQQVHPVQALAIIGQEPVWIFSGQRGPASLSQAKGLRVAAGPAQTSSFLAARLLLERAGVPAGDVRFDPRTGMPAAKALMDGEVDLVFHAASEDAQAVQLLLRNSTVELLGTEHAGALAAQQTHLQPFLLPQGAIELRGDIPARDLSLVSLQTHLLVRPTLHPALQRELLDIATELHEIPTFLQRQGQFPAFVGSDFPLSPVARAYRLGERPWMETLMPYGKAQLAELLLYAVVPILVTALFLLAWIPRLFDWQVSAALHHFYGALKFLEVEMDQADTEDPRTLKRLLERLDTIERQVVALQLPDVFSERWYTLREHLAAARDRLLKLRSA